MALNDRIEEAMLTFELEIRQSNNQLKIDLAKQDAINGLEQSIV